MDNTLLKLLEDIGFTDKEARVYLALLELGQGDVTDISRIAGLKRSIIYVLLEGLIKRGYVSQIPGTKVNQYRALDPSIIHNSLKLKTKNFAEMLPFLNSLSNKGKIKPKIHYYETLEAIWRMYEEMFYAKTASIITSNVRLNKFFPGVHEQWVGDYKKKGYNLKARFLVPDKEKEKYFAEVYKKADQVVKTSELLKEMNMDIVIYSNKVAITALGEEPFMVLIESEEIRKSMEAWFNTSWVSGKSL